MKMLFRRTFEEQTTTTGVFRKETTTSRTGNFALQMKLEVEPHELELIKTFNLLSILVLLMQPQLEDPNTFPPTPHKSPRLITVAQLINGRTESIPTLADLVAIRRTIRENVGIVHQLIEFAGQFDEEEVVEF